MKKSSSLLIFSFLLPICYVFLKLSLTFNSIWHSGSMTYCHSNHALALPPFFYTTSDKIAGVGKESIALTSKSVALFVFFLFVSFNDKNNLRISIVLETTLTSFCRDVQLKHPVLCCLQVKKPSFLLQLQSIFAWAAELQALCGIGYLSEGLESDLFYSVLLKKKVHPRVLEQSKVTAMSPGITTWWLTGKMGWALFAGL